MASESDNRLLFQLCHPFTATIIGPTMSGKTKLTLEIIEKRREIMSVDFDYVIYVYTENQPIFKDFHEKHPEVVFTSNMEEVDNYIGKGKCLIIFDDKMAEFEGEENQEITKWFIRGAHHKSCSIIVMLQNAFAKNMRTCSINSIYSILLNNPRDKSTIINIGKQTHPGRPRFLAEAYEDAVSTPYGYLFFDFHQKTNNQFRIRNSVFPTRDCKVYVPSKREKFIDS